jgi:hypothetical protein
MKGKIELSKAAREADDAVQKTGLRAWFIDHGIELTGLHYVADLRTLRCASLLIDNAPENTFSKGFRAVELSQTAQRMLPVLLAAWLDGFCVGLTTTQEEGQKVKKNE